MTAVQQAIRECPSESIDPFEYLQERFGLQYRLWGNLALLKYDVKKAPKGVRAANECNGLVLKKDTLEVVAYPPPRIYTIHDWCAPDLTKETDLDVRLYPDGVMCTLFNHDGEPCVVSNELDTAVQELFWEAWEHRGLPDPARLPSKTCLTFILTGPKVPHVRPQSAPNLQLLSGRDLSTSLYSELTGCELEGLAKRMGGSLNPVPRTGHKTLEAAKYTAGILDTQPGYLVTNPSVAARDANCGHFPRLMVPNPRYRWLKDLTSKPPTHERILALILEDGANVIVLDQMPSQLRKDIWWVRELKEAFARLLEAEHKKASTVVFPDATSLGNALEDSAAPEVLHLMLAGGNSPHQAMYQSVCIDGQVCLSLVKRLWGQMSTTPQNKQ